MMNLTLTGAEKLAAKLQEKSRTKFDGVCLKNITEIFNRAKGDGTPKDTGELRISTSMKKPSGSGFTGEVGYSKEYAPHVEYGHRTLSGEFVRGQYYLRKNVDAQRPIYKQDLIEALRKE